MIDINLIRENPEKVRTSLSKRVVGIDFSGLLLWDKKRRKLIFEADQLREDKNRVSSEIASMKKEGKDVTTYLDEMKTVSNRIKKLDSQLAKLQERIRSFLESLPNLPDDDVPEGGKENNEIVRTWKKKPEFTFEQKNHIDLVKSLGLVDYERGAKLAGTGFWLYRGEGAKLEWALLNYFIEENLKNNYEFILPPHILTYQCGYTAGQFPKFAEDVFTLKQPKNEKSIQFLLPTAETALINLHRDEVLKEEELPLKYFSYTPCYRREAGSYRANERGMIRGHQFNKVEIFQFTRPEDSETSLDGMVKQAESLVQRLGLHYRVCKLAVKDMSDTMAKTYDIEAWIPSMNEYKEVSSASNARDYQARRGNIKFKRKTSRKNEYVHTLNASGLATSRLFPAIVEQFQQEDGSVPIPDCLRKWLGKEVISPRGF
ncbi:Serine--tRNA ligase [subsurface metagenome]